MNRQLRIATRSSPLALAQTYEVIKLLGQECEIVKVQNETGDLNQKDPLYQMNSVGVFTKQVEDYLLQNKGDIAVHSLKDLPTIIDERLTLVAYSKLEERGDVVILNPKYNFKTLNEVPEGFIIGTSSLRRIMTIKNMHPQIVTKNIRGNLNTRIRKLDEGEYDAIILAKAGINRLGLQDRISFDLDEKQYMYAPGQAALGIQCRIDDPDVKEQVSKLNNQESYYRCFAERQFLNLLEGGCKLPIAVYSEIKQGENIYLKGRVLSDTTFVEYEVEGHYQEVGKLLTQHMIELGAKKLFT